MSVIYVTVKAHMDIDGRITPISITWADGRIFTIDKILDVRPAAAKRSGGVGIRYTCIIRGQERFLWFDDYVGRWFVEDLNDPEPPQSDGRTYSF